MEAARIRAALPPGPLHGTGLEFYADLYAMFAQRGIPAPEVNRMDMLEVWSSLGLHRHPDYWKSDEDLVPTRHRKRDGRGQVRSQRDAPGQTGRDRMARARGQNAARVAAARAGQPEPQTAPAGPDAGTQMLASLVGVIGASQ